MVYAAIQACDGDIRSLMYQNLVLTGGNTLIGGFQDRLAFEMSTVSPGIRMKMHIPGNSVERSCSAWIGGSIVASLGTFHQLWISKKEYEEFGASVLDKR